MPEEHKNEQDESKYFESTHNRGGLGHGGFSYFESWKKLPLFQKASLLSVLLLVIALPVGILLALGPVNWLPKAGGPQNPVTPVVTPPGPGKGATISLTELPERYVSNERFSIVVYLEPNGLDVSAAEIHLSYDPAYFQVDSVTSDSMMPNVLEGPGIDNETGTVSFTVGVIPNSPMRESGGVAHLAMRTKNRGGVGQISFASGTRATAVGTVGNVLTTLNSASMEVLTPSPSPVPSPSASPRPLSRVNVDVNIQNTAVLVNEEFNVAVALNNESILGISAAEIHLTFDPNYVVALGVDQNPYSRLTNELAAPQIDNNQGTISFTLGSSPTSPVTARSVNIANIRFKAMSNRGLSRIRVAESTQIAVVESNSNMVGNMNFAEVNVGRTKESVLSLILGFGGGGWRQGNKSVKLEILKTGSDGNHVRESRLVSVPGTNSNVYEVSTRLFESSIDWSSAVAVYAKGPSHLRRRLGTLTRIVPGENIVNAADLPLIPGDIVDDNKVDLDDFTAMVEDFGRRMPASGSPADLDFDGDVDIDDYNLFVENFGKVGDEVE